MTISLSFGHRLTARRRPCINSSATMSPGLRTLLLYLTAGAVYVALGVFFPRVLLSWIEGTGFLLLAVWLLPALLGLLALRR